VRQAGWKQFEKDVKGKRLKLPEYYGRVWQTERLDPAFSVFFCPFLSSLFVKRATSVSYWSRTPFT
jgi:hypothetical protein